MEKFELAEGTLKAKKGTERYIGNIPGGIALASSDIGRCELEDGTEVYTTWGRNLNKKSQEWYLKKTGYVPIWLGADDGSSELILHDGIIEKLLPILQKPLSDRK